jgi:hypothetical protein
VDTPLSDVDSSGVETVDDSVQREWNRFAMTDRSVDGHSFSTLLGRRARVATTTLAVRAFDSSLAYDSTTALGEAFTKANSRRRAPQ